MRGRDSGQRTADTAAALHRRSRHTPHPARVVTTARPGTRGTWPPVTGHVATRVCIAPACLLPASPCLGPGPPTVAGGRAGRCRTTTCHRPPRNFQMICLLSTIFTIHKTDHNQFSSFYYWISRSAWSLIFNAMLLFLQYFCCYHGHGQCMYYTLRACGNIAAMHHALGQTVFSAFN